jgi:putative transposase
MIIPSSMPRLKGFRYLPEVIAYAVWAYHRFALSTADVEDLLAERGVIESRGTIRLWVNRFGAHFAACIRRDRPKPNDKWHLDEVVITIRGNKHWLWRAIDTNSPSRQIDLQSPAGQWMFSISSCKRGEMQRRPNVLQEIDRSV